MRTIVRLVAIALGLTAALPVVSAAHADTVATAAGVGGRVLPGCHDYSVSYDLNLPEGVVDWDASVDDEDYESSLYLDSYSDAPSGVGRMFFCDSDFEGDGRVRLNVSGAYTNADGTRGRITGRGAVQLKLARTRTRLVFRPSSAPAYNQVIRLHAHVEVQGKYGYQAARYVDVDIQVREAGRWVRLKGRSFLTGGNGRSVERYRWNVRRAVTMRLFTAAQDGFAQSSSKAITIRTRS